MRLKLIPSETKIDFFSKIRLWLGISAVMVIVALGSVGTLGLNYGIDFSGTMIRTQRHPVDGAYRQNGRT